MPLKLKKVFKMDREKDKRYGEICLTSAELAVIREQMDKNRKDLALTLLKRAQLLQQVLLDDCDYTIGQGDRIHFMDQTGEIKVFEKNDSVEGLVQDGSK